MPNEIEKELFNILVIDFLPQNPTMAFDKEIDKVENMKVILYTREHPPAHFHISYNDTINASFLLCDCSHYKGVISQKKIKAVQKWFYSGGKEKLLKNCDELKIF